MTSAALSGAQKRALYRDGFVVLPGVVPAARVDAARRAVFMALGRGESPKGNAAVFVDLFNKTDLFAILEEALGPLPRAPGCQLATRYPSDPSDHVNESGYPDRDTPFFGWHGHLDGLWNGAAPMHQLTDRPMNAAEAEAWHREPARNGCIKAYPKLGANITSFAVLVGVALSDQSREGAGNVGVLKGAHHAMERFFRQQREAGGPLGPDGPGWPRIDTDAPNRSGLRHYPDAVRAAFLQDAARTRDGRLWPKPTLLRMMPGDAALVLHAVPHCATRVRGVEPRLMAYFRVTPKSRPAKNRGVRPDALCDIWSEWPGMADIVAQERA